MPSLWSGKELPILASGSRSRSQILSAAGIPHDIFGHGIDERLIQSKIAQSSGREIAEALATAKAVNVSISATDRMIIGADQTLMLGNELLHKAETMPAARKQLLLLNGQTHILHSAVAVAINGKVQFNYSGTAQIEVRKLSAAFIDRYLDCVGESILDSVGCYHIEGLGAQLFASISGDQFTIMGLPLLPLLEYFRKSEFLTR